MIVSIIVACGNDGVIGEANALLWHIPGDLQKFKQITIGHHILMGRKTFESIGRVLPGRVNLILSKDKDYKQVGAVTVNSVNQAIEMASVAGDSELIICGGGQIYSQTVNLVDRIYLTKVDYQGVGDTFFPSIDMSEWQISQKEEHSKNGTDQYSWSFQVLDRLKNS